jgi:hypothetical protein|nr:MAG TPA: hypothetical protein [Caudoviricetes sp.]
MAIKGSKKVSSRLISNGRASFVYENTDYKFDMIPYGSLLINNETGNIKIKLEGKKDWVPIEEALNKPSNIILQGQRAIQEVFLVLNIDKDNDTITYVNHRGERRHKFLYDDNNITYAVFELDKASYELNKNLISASINNVIECNKQNKKLQELDGRRIGIDLDILSLGCWVTITYYDINKINTSGYNIFLTKDINNKNMVNNSMAIVFDDNSSRNAPAYLENTIKLVYTDVLKTYHLIAEGNIEERKWDIIEGKEYLLKEKLSGNNSLLKNNRTLEIQNRNNFAKISARIVDAHNVSKVFTFVVPPYDDSSIAFKGKKITGKDNTFGIDHSNFDNNTQSYIIDQQTGYRIPKANYDNLTKSVFKVTNIFDKEQNKNVDINKTVLRKEYNVKNPNDFEIIFPSKYNVFGYFIKNNEIIGSLNISV